jgi:phospholipid:diacylglycerol acyltransferase
MGLVRVVVRSKIIENLAVVNYDTNNLYLAPYDWRLSYGNLEVRDGYFSKLKANIEGFVSVAFTRKCSPGTDINHSSKKERKKVVIAAHSMGSTVCTCFSLTSLFVYKLSNNHPDRSSWYGTRLI